MTPHQILLALANYDGLPNEGVEAALAERAAVTPLFLDRIERYLALPAEARDDDPALFPIAFLLAGWRETAAYRPLLRLFRLPDEDLEMLFGDALTEHAHKLVAAVCDGDPRPIHDAILDAEADEYARSRIFDALVMLAVSGVLDRDETIRFVRDAFESLQPRTENMVWSGWIDAVAMLGLADLAPQAKAAIEDLLVPEWTTTYKYFHGDLQLALAHPEAPWRDAKDFAPFGTAADELGGYPGSDRSHAATRPDSGRNGHRFEQGGPIINQFRHIGRNDPCPCGSGLKLKKCCLAKQEAAPAFFG